MYCAPNVNEAFFDDYDEYSCPDRCKELYAPICGQNDDGDQQIFVNSCYMSMENCDKPKNKGFKRDHIIFNFFSFGNKKRHEIRLYFDSLLQYIVGKLSGEH